MTRSDDVLRGSDWLAGLLQMVEISRGWLPAWNRTVPLCPSFLLAATGGALVPSAGLGHGRLGLILATLLEKPQAEIQHVKKTAALLFQQSPQEHAEPQLSPLKKKNRWATSNHTCKLERNRANKGGSEFYI